MIKMLKVISTATLLVTSSLALASPANLTVENTTEHQARAYVNGISKNPAEAHGTMSLSWWKLKFACALKTECQAEVKVKTETDKPLSLGYATINLETGIIDTSNLSHAEGFNVTAVAPGHAIVSQQ